jgi:hypothetical protein
MKIRALLAGFFLMVAGMLTACGGGGGGSDGGSGGPTVTTNKIVVLNNLTPTGYVVNGVPCTGIQGTSSKNTTNTVFNFTQPIAYGASETIYLDNDKCDIYWDLTPTGAANLNLVPNSGAKTFVPCGKTLPCTATIENFVDKLGLVGPAGNTIHFANLMCSAPQ